MDKYVFKNAMQEFMHNREKANETMSKLYDLFGFGVYELFDEVSYEVLFIHTVSEAIDDKSDWLGYFVWECECDFDKFSNNITVGNEHPNVKDFGNLYDFITKKNS